MEFTEATFSGHALVRMFERRISVEAVLELLRLGEKIEDYPNARPFPSCLILGNVEGRPLHVAVAVDPAGSVCKIITVYEPDLAIWEKDFRKRRKP